MTMFGSSVSSLTTSCLGLGGSAGISSRATPCRLRLPSPSVRGTLILVVAVFGSCRPAFLLDLDTVLVVADEATVPLLRGTDAEGGRGLLSTICRTGTGLLRYHARPTPIT